MDNVIKYLIQWYHRQSFLMLSSLAMVAIVVLGGLFFWASQFSHALTDRESEETQLELANSGLQTIKRMVGDNEIWAQSIQKEYNKLFANQQNNVSPISRTENFTPQYSSINQNLNRVNSN
jgi:hypothetical protein